MFTTTPRFSPRDGDEPKPMTSTLPSGDSSPTTATTFDVPTSRPTKSLRSSRLATALVPPFLTPFALHRQLHSRGHLRLLRLRLVAPADGETVRVAQVDIAHPMQLPRKRGCGDTEETIDALVHVDAAEPDFLAGREQQPPRAALVEVQPFDRKVRLEQPLAHREVHLRDLALAAGRPVETRQLRKAVRRPFGEELAARVQKTAVAPSSGRAMLRDAHDEHVGPPAPQRGRVDPRERLQPRAQRLEIERPETVLEPG